MGPSRGRWGRETPQHPVLCETCQTQGRGGRGVQGLGQGQEGGATAGRSVGLAVASRRYSVKAPFLWEAGGAVRFMKGFILKRLLKGLGNHWKEVKSSQPSGFLVVDAVLPVHGSGGWGGWGKTGR